MPITTINITPHIFRGSDFISVVKKAVDFLARTPEHQLPLSGNFSGVGVYAIYYSGNFEQYQKISTSNQKQRKHPIYIGKAVPAGWRTARNSIDKNSHALCTRIREHERSIEQGGGIHIVDFKCQFMILRGVETELVSAVEAQLIRTHKPLWNTLIDGFGNHDPGKGRYNQARSNWDILHPGRPWADRLTGKHDSHTKISEKISRYI